MSTADCSIFAASCQQCVLYINFLSHSMKLLNNLNGSQALHFSHRAVAYHIKIGNVQIWNVQIWNAQIGDVQIGNIGKCWDGQNGMPLLGHHNFPIPMWTSPILTFLMWTFPTWTLFLIWRWYTHYTNSELLQTVQFNHVLELNISSPSVSIL